MKFLTLALLGALIFLGGCLRHNPDIPLTPVLTFTKDISPIMAANCAISGCHDGSGEVRPLISYHEVMRHVTAGKPYQSSLFTTTINLTFNRMPPKANMGEESIKAIYIWILQGAKE